MTSGRVREPEHANVSLHHLSNHNNKDDSESFESLEPQDSVATRASGEDTAKLAKTPVSDPWTRSCSCGVRRATRPVAQCQADATRYNKAAVGRGIIRVTRIIV